MVNPPYRNPAKLFDYPPQESPGQLQAGLEVEQDYPGACPGPAFQGVGCAGLAGHNGHGLPSQIAFSLS